MIVQMLWSGVKTITKKKKKKIVDGKYRPANRM